ncbi:MAG TPA: hypothetical protein VG713_12145, partial [Pirellulales bacterium]|nr:hypothetical protein [Pirellulales bacterium]
MHAPVVQARALPELAQHVSALEDVALELIEQRTWRVDSAAPPQAMHTPPAPEVVRRTPVEPQRTETPNRPTTSIHGLWYVGVAAAATVVLMFLSVEGSRGKKEEALPTMPVEPARPMNKLSAPEPALTAQPASVSVPSGSSRKGASIGRPVP